MHCCHKIDGNKFSMFLNFFDVISEFFLSFFDIFFLCFVFLYYVFSIILLFYVLFLCFLLQTDLQYQARGCGQGKVKRATGKASSWGPRPHFEKEKASLVWACGVFQWCNQNSIWYADWRQAGGREAQANMEETDRERLPWVEAHHSWPSRKEHLEIRCEICYACS